MLQSLANSDHIEGAYPLLSLGECIGAVEEAFRLNEEGQSLPPGVLETLTDTGGFYIKAAGLKLAERTYYAAKVNANFPQNMSKWELPTIQGIIALFDGESGYLLALLDSIEITALHTGAATAVAAKYLARCNSRVATVCGCGVQGRVQLKSLAQVFRLEKVYAYDQVEALAGKFAGEMSAELKIEVIPDTDLPRALGESDVCHLHVVEATIPDAGKCTRRHVCRRCRRRQPPEARVGHGAVSFE